MQVREFNARGIEAFRNRLAAMRDGAASEAPLEMLEDPAVTQPMTPAIDVENRTFASRREAADYFHEVFQEVPPERLRESAGLWTWLSLFYFDQICPESGGRRKVRNDYTYVYMPHESRYFYRHLLFVAWYVKHLAPCHNRLFLDVPVKTLDTYTEDVTKRLYLTRIPCIFEVLDRLYWDTSTGRPLKGVISPGKVVAGDLIHRLPVRIRQLEKTYDLQSLEADQLVELLGEEFQQLVAKTSTISTE